MPQEKTVPGLDAAEPSQLEREAWPAFIRAQRREEVPAATLGLILSFRRVLVFLIGIDLVLLASGLLNVQGYLRTFLRDENSIFALLFIMSALLARMMGAHIEEPWDAERSPGKTLSWSLFGPSASMATLVTLAQGFVIPSNAASWLASWCANLILAFFTHAALHMLFVGRKRQLSTRGFSIAFFRSFDAWYSRSALHELAPDIACYGRLVYLTDVIFSVETDTIASMEGAFHAHWVDLSYNAESTDASWRRDFFVCLSKAHVAVLDVSKPSANIRWELKQCLSNIGPERIILVAHRDADSEGFVDNYQSLWPPDQVNPGVLWYGSGVLARWRFRLALYGRMQALTAGR